MVVLDHLLPDAERHELAAAVRLHEEAAIVPEDLGLQEPRAVELGVEQREGHGGKVPDRAATLRCNVSRRVGFWHMPSLLRRVRFAVGRLYAAAWRAADPRSRGARPASPDDFPTPH